MRPRVLTSLRSPDCASCSIQGTPVPLRKLLDSHQIQTAYELGWSRLTCGDLLAAVSQEGFEVFVTTDKNIVSQQNLTGLPFAIIVLSSTTWPRIRVASYAVASAIEAASPRAIVEVAIP